MPRIRAACVAVAVAATVGLLALATPAHADTLTLNPTADAYVNKFSPASNFGSANPLEALAAPASKERYSYLRFNVTVPAGQAVTGVTLKLYVAKLPVGNMFINATSSTWIETGTGSINWNNKPALGAELARVAIPTVTGYYPITLPASSVVAGDNSFTVQETNSTTNLQFYSREDATRKPQLVVTTASVAQAPVADFTGTPTSGQAPLAVQFTDTSTASPTSWLWDFGDGGTSTVQNPSHTYSAAGSYTVTLTATNAAGSDAEVKAGYITVTAPPPPGAPTVTTGTATSITQTSATLGGTANPNNDPTNCHFDYGLAIPYSSATPTQAIGSGGSTVNVSAPVTGLTAGTPYHFRLSCTNAVGTTDGADATFTTTSATPDLLTRRDLLYAGEVGAWREASLAIDNTTVQQKMIESGSSMMRFAIDDCFTDMTCGWDNHTGTRSVTEFRHTIQVITQTTGKQLWFKMLPIAKDIPVINGQQKGNTFCPPWTGDASGNLPVYRRILDEIKNAGYLGPIVIETNNEMEYTCWEYWKSQGAPIQGAGYQGVSKRIGEHYAAVGPAIKSYAQGLGFSQVAVGGYIGVGGGPQWGQACTVDPTKPYGYACGYQTRWMTEFNDAVVAAGVAPPDFEAIHSYNHGDDFATAPWTFDDNIAYAYYRNWITQSRTILRTKWGTTAGDNIRLAMSEWNAGESPDSGPTWSGWTITGQPGAFYDGWYAMLRGDDNLAGGTRWWESSLFCVACNSDTGGGRYYDVIRQDGTVPDWFYNWKTAALSGL